MIETNKICEILEGIDQDEINNGDGWWETSFGAKFGKEKLKELLAYIELEKKDIGLKDINGKSIYADSSILEFVLTNQRVSFKVFGVFKFHKQNFSYFIEVLKCDDVDCYGLGINNIPYGLYREIISDIKIIDTIQENKLGLIK